MIEELREFREILCQNAFSLAFFTKQGIARITYYLGAGLRKRAEIDMRSSSSQA